MLALNLRPKVVPHGPRLLLGLIVRISGRLVAGRPRSGPEPPGSSGLALTDPEVITLAILAQ